MYTCLVIEDEKIIRKWIRYGFDYSKYNCAVIGEAENGLDGVTKIKELQPDIVITDITMPIKSAFEMLDETAEQLYATIIISGFADFSNAQQAIKHGAVEFIVKPIDEKELATALKKAIANLESQKLLHQAKVNLATAEAWKDQLIPETKDSLVNEMLKFIENNYAKKFIFDDVVDLVGYSASSLYQKFKKETNLTFNDYLSHYRIQKAIELIKNGDFRLYEIPEQIGFADYKYFSQIFKKHTGFSPKQFSDANF